MELFSALFAVWSHKVWVTASRTQIAPSDTAHFASRAAASQPATRPALLQQQAPLL